MNSIVSLKKRNFIVFDNNGGAVGILPLSREQQFVIQICNFLRFLIKRDQLGVGIPKNHLKFKAFLQFPRNV